jgi:hypothetical protein
MSQELFLRANDLGMRVSDRTHFHGTICICLFASGAMVSGKQTCTKSIKQTYCTTARSPLNKLTARKPTARKQKKHEPGRSFLTRWTLMGCPLKMEWRIIVDKYMYNIFSRQVRVYNKSWGVYRLTTKQVALACLEILLDRLIRSRMTNDGQRSEKHF